MLKNVYKLNFIQYIFSFKASVPYGNSDIITIVVEREPSGLGLSIAGGKESTPYKGEDEVCKHINIKFHIYMYILQFL